MQQKQKYIDAPLPPKKKTAPGRVFFFLVLLAAVGVYAVKFHFGKDVFSQVLNITVEETALSEPEKPFLPDISHITVEAVEAKVPRVRKGAVLHARITLFPEFRKFMEGDAPRRLRLFQRRVNPRALVVSAGHYDWRTLYNEVKSYDPDGDIIRKEGTVYTLRRPLLVLDGASLTISGKDVSELRLSKQANSYLVNAGDLFIVRTRVVAWDEEKNAPDKFVDKHHFRPFITTWDGSHLYLAGSEFVSLGYLKGKSYGISFSACTPCAKVTPGKPASTGIVVGNRFTDLFYGFYSYETEDVAIVGNVYDDNIIYGIDPHDRSRRLIIAKNETYGTLKKHGIIVSREVNDSWIFGNYSHHNKGSGIMIDRTSVNNVIADNVVEYNDQDGLTFFESENNTTWGNILRHNKKNGVRIRNSWDIKLYNDEINNNGGTSVEVYTADLSGQKTRDFELDPYTQKADVVVNGAKISTSGAAVFKIIDSDFMRITNTDVKAATHLFPVSFQYDKKLLHDNVGRSDAIVTVRDPNYAGAPVPVKRAAHGSAH